MAENEREPARADFAERVREEVDRRMAEHMLAGVRDPEQLGLLRAPGTRALGERGVGEGVVAAMDAAEHAHGDGGHGPGGPPPHGDEVDEHEEDGHDHHRQFRMFHTGAGGDLVEINPVDIPIAAEPAEEQPRVVDGDHNHEGHEHGGGRARRDR